MSTMITKEETQITPTREMKAPLCIFEEMDQLFSGIEQRAFELFQSRGAIPGWELDDWLRAEAEILRPVRVDVEEKEKELVVRAEMPGFDPKEVTVTSDPYRLRLYGKSERRTKEPQKEESAKSTILRNEISSNEVLREIDLPVRINPDAATAHLEKGVLEVRLPKAAPPKLIEVKAGK